MMTYLLLLALQLCGAIFFVWQELPEFRQVVINPGEQLSRESISDLLMVGVVLHHASLILDSAALLSHSVPTPE